MMSLPPAANRFLSLGFFFLCCVDTRRTIFVFLGLIFWSMAVIRIYFSSFVSLRVMMPARQTTPLLSFASISCLYSVRPTSQLIIQHQDLMTSPDSPKRRSPSARRHSNFPWFCRWSGGGGGVCPRSMDGVNKKRVIADKDLTASL